jgi:single-strand DNA-binding protein
MRGLNKVMLIGNATAQCEARYTAGGSAVASVSIATNEQWKDKQTGELQERAEFHRLKFFGRLAEIAAEYITKGKQIYVEGSLRTDKYTDKQGIERYSTDIIVSDLQLLGGAERGERNDSSRSGGQTASRQSASRPAAPAPAAVPETEFDDIPF